VVETPIRLAIIIGSVRSGRFGPVVADWFLSQLKLNAEFDVDVIDLADLVLPHDLDGTGDTNEFAERVNRADAFVVITPEYNHGYPGQLKTAIDSVRDEWRAKPVAFISYGGMAGGLRSVEQLRLVFTELQMVTIRQAVSFHWVHDQFDEGGCLRDPDRANAAAQALLTQLSWWACSLREGRTARPYQG
jgi:NAD(P)H-dependent FMN reductase